MIKRLIYCLCLLSFFACGSAGEAENKDNTLTDTSEVKLLTGLSLVQGMQLADSLQIIYYDDPDGDSLRYSRFFKYINSSDTGLMNAFRMAIDKPLTPEDRARSCRSEGKLYVYKSDDVVKTIYFSTRCTTCCYLYYIHNGRFYYFEMNDKLATLLNEWKQKSMMPVATDAENADS